MTNNSGNCEIREQASEKSLNESLKTAKRPPSNDFILTLSGRRIYLRDQVTGSQVDIEDIAHSLSIQNRFLGHTRHPYSIAQHCLNCVAVALEFHAEEDPNTLLALLMHDAAEAYIGDIVRPIKYMYHDAVEAGRSAHRIALRNIPLPYAGFEHLSQVYEALSVAYNIEERMEFAIFRHYNIPHFEPQALILIKEIDTRLCATESSILCAEPMPPNVPMYPLEPKAFDCYDWQTVKAKFLNTFHQLIQLRNDAEE